MRWWAEQPDEIFWLEITEREDLGLDLNAPAEREGGTEYWSYAFVQEVREGDIVLHYRTRPRGTLTHWSRAVGEPYRDEVLWGAHGQESGRGPVAPYLRPGWRHPLDGPYELAEPVTPDQLRDLEPRVREFIEQLQGEHPREALYFPFQLSDKSPLRAFQGYLTKFPRALVTSIPQLVEIDRVATQTRPTAASSAPAVRGQEIGGEYRPANPRARTARREPFTVDPDLVDRALGAHAETQDRLDAVARAAGFAPRSPLPGEPVFDIAWEDGETVVVAQVKSLTERNKEKQLRLALGKVLRYDQLLAVDDCRVRRVIAVERKPRKTRGSRCARSPV